MMMATSDIEAPAQMKSVEEIVGLYRQRTALYAPLHAGMRLIQAIYANRMEINLGDMDRTAGAATPNLLANGVDQMAGRISSVIPTVVFAPTKPGQRNAERNAFNAARTVQGWWQVDRLPMKLKQRARHLIAYGMSPVVIRWDFEENRPIWHVRHPLETYPSPDLSPGQVTPTDCIFAYKRSVGWLKANGYGMHVYSITRNYDTPNDAMVTLLEYIDEAQTQLVAVSLENQWTSGAAMPGSKGVTLEWFENKGDECPVVIPSRITLDTITGQFDNMVGMYYQQAKLMALEIIAIEKGIFPDVWVETHPGMSTAEIVDGPHDGRSGLINILKNGTIKEIQSQPGYMTGQIMDRLERASRVTAGLPQEFGGESGSNIRTGVRGNAVLANTIDFPLAEAQEILAFGLNEENEVAIALAKAWDGDNQRTLYVGTGNTMRPVTYTPNKTFETDEHMVSYPVSGADQNTLAIGIGQRVGLGYMSKMTAAKLDPWIEDPEAEHDAVIAEGLEQAVMTSLQQKAASGEITPIVISQVSALVRNDKMELAEALNKVTEDAMKAQQAAQEAQGPPPDAMAAAAPGAVGALAGPQSPIPGSGAMPGMKSLSDVLSTLRRPVMTVRPMRGQQQGAV